jgi:hypothetical protein
MKKFAATQLFLYGTVPRDNDENPSLTERPGRFYQGVSFWF